MAQIQFSVDVRDIRDSLQNEAEEYVKTIWDKRKFACIEEAGQVLYDNGYLPHGTTWEAFYDGCWFSVDKGTGADLAHYFHEGQMYGPNIPIFERDRYGNKTGSIKAFYSPKGKQKYPIPGKMLNQGPNEPAGVYHWTEAIQENGKLYQEYIDRCAEILRR